MGKKSKNALNGWKIYNGNPADLPDNLAVISNLRIDDNDIFECDVEVIPKHEALLIKDGFLWKKLELPDFDVFFEEEEG